MAPSSSGKRKHIGFILGIAAFLVVYFIPAPEGLSAAAWHTAAVALLMAVWWIGEVLPIAATALLPVILFPVLGIASISEATTPYANPIIFLFLGGFVIAQALERWDLHKRIALNIVNYVGLKPSSIILGFIIASAFLSMWVSNTATALMMLPIGLSVLQLLEEQKEELEEEGTLNFDIVLLLAIAYGCNIGGMGTIIGTPANALLAGFMSENYGFEIGFGQWMLVGIPLLLIALPLMYILLAKVVYPIKIDTLPGGKELIKGRLSELGTIKGTEQKVAAIFIVTALLWIFRPLLTAVVPGLSDGGIAIAAAVSFFIIPADFREGQFLLEWSDVEQLPWGVLLLFGGGLSLASSISNTGLADWIGQGVSVFGSWSILFVVTLVVTMIVFLTEITSNTAVTAAFLPIMASVAIGLGENPLILAVPAALGASCAFMMPVATPPNAIIYGSGKLRIPQMSKAGLWLNIVFIFLLTAGTFVLFNYVFGVVPGVLPGWAS